MPILCENFALFVEEEQFYHSYQPLYSLKGREVVGNEILLRAEIGPPSLLFEQAIMENKLYELDTKSIYKALSTHCLKLKNRWLFLNIFPSTLTDPEFPSFLKLILNEFPECNRQIVFELNETEKAEPILFVERVKMLKEFGFLVAIDDVGKGWSTLRRIIELEPHFIKLDIYFAELLSTSKRKQMMIKSMVEYCQANDVQVILEGIETEEDLKIAMELGITYGQGFLLCKPKVLKRK